MSAASDDEFPCYLRAYFPCRIDYTKFILGEDSHDLRFTVTLDPVPRKNPLMVIYDGPTDDGDTLVTISKPKDHLGKLSTTIQVSDIATVLSNRFDDIHRLYKFSLKVGGSRREKFEWRPSEGKEVQEMFRHAKGYKLVRLKSVGPGAGKGGKRKDRQLDETSDGKEVVAVWATKKSLVPSNLRMDVKPFKFELRASGKSGELGSEFGYFALATALRIWSYKALGITGFRITD
ncbi:hypothetical protein K445DRAFT_17288 [Daldinia sp. EC12]|nr:hypothetical protein K445DRAFT_17288 [Daldinia sp. EC12]